MKLSAVALVFGLSLGIAGMAAAAPYEREYEREQKLLNPSAQDTSTQPSAQGTSTQADTMKQHGCNDGGKLKAMESTHGQ